MSLFCFLHWDLSATTTVSGITAKGTHACNNRGTRSFIPSECQLNPQLTRSLVFVLFLDRRLESANAFANSFAELRKFSRTEHKQSNSEDNQQMHRLKQSLKHLCLPCVHQEQLLARSGRRTAYRASSALGCEATCGSKSSRHRICFHCELVDEIEECRRLSQEK